MRTLASELVTAMASDVVRPRYIAEIDFPSGISRLWMGVGDLSWNGNTYLGAGDAISVSDVEHTGNLEATPMSVVLNGVNQANRAEIFDVDYQNRPVDIWVAFFDENEAMIGQPIATRFGFITKSDFVEDDEGNQSIPVTISDEMEDVRIDGVHRYTDAGQAIIDPDDEFFSSPPDEAEEVIW